MTDESPKSQTNKEAARRRVLKRLVAGGGFVATGKMMPDDWQKPVIESVILPVHAQMSPEDTEEEPPPSNTNTTVSNSVFLLKKPDSPIA